MCHKAQKNRTPIEDINHFSIVIDLARVFFVANAFLPNVAQGLNAVKYSLDVKQGRNYGAPSEDQFN